MRASLVVIALLGLIGNAQAQAVEDCRGTSQFRPPSTEDVLENIRQYRYLKLGPPEKPPIGKSAKRPSGADLVKHHLDAANVVAKATKQHIEFRKNGGRGPMRRQIKLHGGGALVILYGAMLAANQLCQDYGFCDHHTPVGSGSIEWMLEEYEPQCD